MTQQVRKLILIRLDRLGDLLLTIPVDTLSCLKGYETQWVVPQNFEFVLEHSLPQRAGFSVSEQRFSLKNIWKFYSQLRKISPDVAIVFHAPWWIGLALFMARVPVRAGVKSQWSSYLFFNRGIRQKRSQAQKHELQYNVELVLEALKSPLKEVHPSPDNSPYLSVADVSAVVSFSPPMIVEPIKLKRIAGVLSADVIIHPGMGGSARNWPGENYSTLIDKILAETSLRVLVTGSLQDQDMVETVLTGKHLSERLKEVVLNSPVEWIETLSHASILIAPSTGTLHMGAALGLSVIGIYSPVQVQTSRRWGPLGPQALAVTPRVDCPAKFSCLQLACPRYDCMRDISVDDLMLILKRMDEKNN